MTLSTADTTEPLSSRMANYTLMASQSLSPTSLTPQRFNGEMPVPITLLSQPANSLTMPVLPSTLSVVPRRSSSQPPQRTTPPCSSWVLTTRSTPRTSKSSQTPHAPPTAWPLLPKLSTITSASRRV